MVLPYILESEGRIVNGKKTLRISADAGAGIHSRVLGMKMFDT